MPHRKMIVRPVLIALLLGIVAFTPSMRASPQLGVVVKEAHYDKAKNVVAIKFYNSSRQDVTAFHFSLRIDYVDGTTRLEDRATELPLETWGGPENFLFLAGTERNEELPQPPALKEVRRVVGVVDMVAYGDRTAEVTNEDAFNSLVERREANALALQKVSEVMKQALSTKDNPGQTALNELERLNKIYKAKDGQPRETAQEAANDAAMSAQLDIAIINLHNFGPAPEAVQAFKDHYDQHLAAANLHKQLRRVN